MMPSESMIQPNYILPISLSIFVGLFLQVLPLPETLVWFRPQWLFMILMYWAMVAPQRIGVGWAWTFGLLMDLLLSAPLGCHALSYALISYLLIKFHPQLKLFPLWQQLIMLLVLTFLNLLVQYCILNAVGIKPHAGLYWSSSVTSILFWPWIRYLLRDYAKTYA